MHPQPIILDEFNTTNNLRLDYFILLPNSDIIDGDMTALVLQVRELQRKNHELKRELLRCMRRR